MCVEITNDKYVIDTGNINENILTLYSIDKPLVPKYLDDLKKKNNTKEQEVDKDNLYYQYL